MAKTRAVFVALLIVGGVFAGFGPVSAAGRECHSLTCNKCEKLCHATCEADAVQCNAKHKRGCPAAYRSCERGCRAELCAQCMPIQYDGANRKFLPGKTELCSTPGHSE